MKQHLTLLVIAMVCIAQLHAQPIVNISADDKKYQVLDLTGIGKVTWGGYDEIGLPAKSQGNGKLNTKAIVTAVGGNSGYNGQAYAAKICDTITVNGLDDWYLPAKDEAAIIYLNMNSFGWTESMTLWTSTEASGTQAVTLYTYNGTWYDVQKVDPYNLVCIRKME